MISRVVRLAAIICLGLAVSCDAEKIVVPDDPVVSAIVVTAVNTAILAGDTTRVVAIAVGETGSTISAYPVTWSSSDTTIAVVSSAGIVRGRTPGSVNISATGGGHTGNVTIRVLPVPARSIVISPATPTITAGDTIRLFAQVLDSAGNVLTGRTVKWTSETPAIATVSETGLVRTLQLGQARIVASVEGVSASVVVTTLPGGVRSVSVVPSFQIVYAGGSEVSTGIGEIQPIAVDARGLLIPRHVLTYTFSSEDPSKVVVTQNGSVVGVSEAPSVRVFATTSGVRGEAAVRVVKVIGIKAGDFHACFLLSTGETYCWGRDGQGELGTGRVGFATSFPSPVAGNLRFTSISVGANTSCGTTGEGAAYCWGANYAGQLGDSTSAGARVAPVAVRTSVRFRQLSVGRYHTCGISTAVQLYCWGETAVGFNSWVSYPRIVNTSVRFSSVSVGARYQCGIDEEGAAWCWGVNEWGQLGNGSVTVGSEFVAEPARVLGNLSFKQIAASRTVTCGVTTAGRLYCWGKELGDSPTPRAITSPQLVDGNLTFDSVALFDTNVCGVTPDKKAYCRGAVPGSGALISESMGEVQPPGAAVNANYVQITLGSPFRCALTLEGMPSCWGSDAAAGRSGTLLLTPLPLSRPQLFSPP